MNYLLGGSTFVVGNLWDVTDRDLDKFSIESMSKLFPRLPTDNNNEACNQLQQDSIISISESIQSSRQICKLKYVVGCAPVTYGLPSKLVWRINTKS